VKVLLTRAQTMNDSCPRTSACGIRTVLATVRNCANRLCHFVLGTFEVLSLDELTKALRIQQDAYDESLTEQRVTRLVSNFFGCGRRARPRLPT